MAEISRIPEALPQSAWRILRCLEDAGFEAWVVGGFVRDALLDAKGSDVDIATDAPWQEVQRVCEAAGMRTFETGVQHGTLTVAVETDAIPEAAPSPAAASAAVATADKQSGPWETVEVTTFRTDGSYADARHPDSVTFVKSIEEDLARRDLTINALAWNPSRGLLDPYGGMDDLEAGMICTVGNPRDRFAEDALRILRACRFASQLGFRIDDAVMREMVSHKSLLAKVAPERICRELDKMLLGDHVCEALLECADVVEFVLPEIVAMWGFEQRTPYHIYSVWEHTVRVVGNTPPDLALRWAALCHDMGKPGAFFLDDSGRGHFYGHAALSEKMARGLAGRLRMPTALKDQICALVRSHDDVIKADSKGVRRALLKYGGDVPLFRKLLSLKRADCLEHAPGHTGGAETAAELERILDRVIADEEAFSLRQLAIGGNDLLESGMEQGPEIGKILERALSKVIDGELPNERDAILDWIAEASAAELS